MATPYNLVTGKSYKGGNITRLSGHSYPTAAWVTLRQANKLGGKVRKDEHGTKCFHFKWEVYEDEKTGKRKRRRVMNVFYVFNVAQCDLPEDVLTDKLREETPDPNDCFAALSS